MSATKDFQDKLDQSKKKKQEAVADTITGHMRKGLEDMIKTFGRGNKSAKLKKNQLTTDHDKRENHIIQQKRNRREEAGLV